MNLTAISYDIETKKRINKSLPKLLPNICWKSWEAAFTVTYGCLQK